MIYLFYIIIFVIVGMALALIFRYDEKKAYISIIAITILWAFVMGPWAIAAFVELIIGYTIAKENESLFMVIGELIAKAFVFLLVIGVLVAIVFSMYKSDNTVDDAIPIYISPEQQCKNNGNLWTYNQLNSSWECKSLYSLNVQTVPADARVRIMNIKPKYYDGIRLTPGRYDIRVDKKGFYTKDFYIELTKNSVYDATLTRKLYY